MHSRVLALLRGSSHGWSRKCRKSKSSKSSGEHPCCGQTSFSSWPEVVASGLEPLGLTVIQSSPSGRGSVRLLSTPSELQGWFAAREHDVGLAPAVGLGIEHRKGGGDGLRQFLSRGENPGVRADEIRVAEPAFRRGPILGAARPEVAPGKAAEHRRTPGLCALAL